MLLLPFQKLKFSITENNIVIALGKQKEQVNWNQITMFCFTAAYKRVHKINGNTDVQSTRVGSCSPGLDVQPLIFL